MTEATGETGHPRLSGEELAELLTLLKEADSVELKLTVPESLRRSAVDALELDPLDAQMRQVYFFDTPDLALNRAGVVVRARRIHGEPNDSVVKLRPVDPSQLPSHLRKAEDFVVEVDAMSTGFVCSGSYKHTLAGDEMPAVVKGDKTDPQAVQQGAAGVLREPRARRHRPGRPQHPRSDHRGQAQVLPQGLRPQGGRPSCGCTQTDPASSSCRRSALPRMLSTLRSQAGRSSSSAASRFLVSSTPRPRPPSSSTPRS